MILIRPWSRSSRMIRRSVIRAMPQCSARSSSPYVPAAPTVPGRAVACCEAGRARPGGPSAQFSTLITSLSLSHPVTGGGQFSAVAWGSVSPLSDILASLVNHPPGPRVLSIYGPGAEPEGGKPDGKERAGRWTYL